MIPFNQFKEFKRVFRKLNDKQKELLSFYLMICFNDVVEEYIENDSCDQIMWDFVGNIDDEKCNSIFLNDYGFTEIGTELTIVLIDIIEKRFK